ncbi:hypothetical protein FGIG_11132 [Fasciola gigantica]|uniref:Uncharacterized protein n=1 Tax=Fasciola gigantica TaxID=46835 RepID=A0A504YN68_FASGI|nr:hypothetical protein FGIG_11132 [Fasciola gigantica]
MQFLKRNSKNFYRRLAKATHAKPGISDMPKADGAMTGNNTNVANMLATYCSSVFARNRPGTLSTNGPATAGDSSHRRIGSISFSTVQARRKLGTLKTWRSPGIDEISPRMLQQCADPL